MVAFETSAKNNDGIEELRKCMIDGLLHTIWYSDCTSSCGTSSL